MTTPTRHRVTQLFLWLLRIYLGWAVAVQLLPWPWTYGPLRYHFPSARERFVVVHLALGYTGLIVGYMIIAITPIWVYFLHFRLRRLFPKAYTLSTWWVSALLFVPFYGLVEMLLRMFRYRNLVTDHAHGMPNSWKQSLFNRASGLFFAWFAMFAAMILGVLSVNMYVSSLVVVGTVFNAVTSLLMTDIFSQSALYLDFVLPLLFLWTLARTVDAFENVTADDGVRTGESPPGPPRNSGSRA